MTVSNLNTKNSYNGDGTATQFTYSFPIHSTAELQVIERSALGTETVKTLTTDYSIVDNGSAGGTVTFGTAPASGVTVVLLRNTNLTQGVDYIANDAFPAETHEAALDKLTFQIQEAQEEIDRSIKLSRTNTMTSTEFTNSASDRAGKILAFDTTGELSVATTLGSNKGNWATATAYTQRDIVKDTSNNNVYMANTAHTSTGSQPLSSNADIAKWDLLVDAASATTSATNAATSETNAATSATNAATSATNAATSATNAATSETNAAASFDSFDDRFLGTKSSDPSVDNDGNALAEGTCYYNSTSNEIKFYNGSAWHAPETNAATSATNAASSATAAATSETNAASSASSASTSASTATTQATAASTSATNASTSETNAASSASTAATHKTDAETAKTAAETAKTAAEAAQTAAELSADNFDALYLGAKSSDPTVDNDGDALTAGDLYYSTSSNLMRIYSGSVWEDVAVSTTGFATTGLSIAMSVAL